MSEGISIKINIDDKQIQRKIAAIAKTAKNLQPAFAEIGEHMLRSTDERFKNEISPEGQKWQPLAVATLESYYTTKKRKARGKKGSYTKAFKKYVGAKKILTKAGHLRRVIYKATNNSVTIGNNKQAKGYAAIHQFGGKAGRGRKVTIPARAWLGVSDEDQKEIREIIFSHIREAT